MFKILVVEDETNLRNAFVRSLKDEGYDVIEAYDGQNALEIFCEEHIDLVITDVMMPRMDGNVFVNEVRQINSEVPILMLTALETIHDKEKGFNNGVDDYLVKPIQLRELHLRVKALLKRYKMNTEKKLEINNTVLDFNSQSLKINGSVVELSKKEFLLLFKLVSNPDNVYSREQLISEIWGYSSTATDRTIDTHISWLRQKAVSNDFEIISVWGLGYKAVIK